MRTKIFSGVLNKKFKLFAFGIAACIMLPVFYSCEVGLGPAVDTQPPTITIDKPEVDMVIRNQFVMSGAWTDDGTIEDVYVILKRTDGNPVDGNRQAEKDKTELKIQGIFEKSLEVKGEGTWKVEVDPFDEENLILDGTYQATVYIKDKGSHTTTQSTTFTIDNTAPVLILSKPNSKPGDKTMSAYGQRLFLEGSVADATKDTWIQINFYLDEECTQLLTTLETQYIAPTDVNSNNAKLASFNEDLTVDLAKEYFDIYKDEAGNDKIGKDGKSKVYATLTVYDTAQTCTDEEIEQEYGLDGKKIKGNASQTFFISKDLANSITKSQEAGGYGFAPIDLYNLLNKTYELKNSSRSIDSIEVTEELEELQRNKTVFTINPENSPYFTVSGLKTLSGQNLNVSDNGYFVINGAQSLEISVFMGSDSIELVDDEDFYVYLLKCDAYGVPYEDSEPIPLYSKSDETGTGVDKKTYYEIGGKEDHKTTSGAYVFTVPVTKSLKVNPDLEGADAYAAIPLEFSSNYLICVSGKDNEDNPIEAYDSGYAFHFTSSGSAPVMNLEKPRDNTVFLKKDANILFEGSVKTEEGKPQVSIWNGDYKIADVPIANPVEGELNSFSYEINAEEFEEGDITSSNIYSISVKVSADGNTDSVTEVQRSVWYDIEGPDIKVNSIQPIVTANGKTNNINGKLTVKGTIIDKFDQFGSASYRVLQDGEPVEGLCGTLTSSFEFEIDTTKLQNEKEAVIEIEAYDRAGNKSVWSGDSDEDGDAVWVGEYFVDQSTDKPVIKSTSESVIIGSEANSEDILTEGKNLFVRGGTLVLNVEDDDSVKSAIVKLAKKRDDGGFEEATSADTTGTLYKTYNNPSAISHSLPTTVGVYRATITVYDKFYVSDAATPNNFNECEFILRITGTGPDVTVSTQKDYISTRAGAGTNKLTFTITDDGNGPYKLYKDNEPLFNGVRKNSPIEYTIEYPKDYAPENPEEVIFRVEDTNQGFTEKIYKPKFDNGEPEVAISATPTTALTEESSYLFKGTMSDTPAGIDSIKIKFADVTDSTVASEWLDCIAGSQSWNYEAVWAGSELGAVFATEGSKTVTVKAIDNAGNEKTVSDTFVYDKMKPVIESVSGPENTNGADVTYQITVKDTNPESLSVVVKQNGSAVTPAPALTISQLTGSGTTYTGTVVVPFGSGITQDGSYEIEFVVNDVNGKSSASKTVEITRDSASPVVSNVKLIEETGVKDAYYNNDNGKYYVNNTRSSYKISGIATDNVGVESVELVITNKDDETVALTPARSGSLGQWSFTGIDLSSWNSSGATAAIIVKDKAGNQAQENVNLDIVFDTQAPAAEHQIDDSHKDLVFRIGDYANDAGQQDVGGKYSNGTYGSALTMQIRGNYPDNEGGSGINKIYYKVFAHEVTIDENRENGAEISGKIYFQTLDDLRDYVIANKTDSFAPLAATETRNVEYNITPAANVDETVDRIGDGTLTNGYNLTSKGYLQFRKSITSNYKTTIKGFQEGRNYLVIVAEDNVGNSSVDHAEVPTPEDPTVTAIYPCYSLNVDITAPTIPTKQSGTVYTNLSGNTPVYISGTVSDKSSSEEGSSGLSKIVFTSDQSELKVTVSSSAFTAVDASENPNNDPTLKRWTANIRSLLNEDGTAIISAKVSDNAGYETSVPVANVLVDSTAPSVIINSPAFNAKTGTTVNISGTVNDGTGSGVDSSKPMVLYYTTNTTVGGTNLTQIPAANTDAAAGWVQLAQITPESNGSWSYELDASTITTDGENNIRFFTVSATDKAGDGNTGFAEPVRITVDRKKPVIDNTVSGIGNQTTAENVNGHWFNATTLKVFGKYTDESGSGVSTISYKIGSGNVEELSTTNGSYSVNISDFTAGENIFTIWATDAAGNKSDETTYTFNIDNIQPVITSVSGTETTQGQDVVLTVNLKDVNPIVPEVVVKQNGTAVAPAVDVTVSEPVGSGTSYTSTVTVPFASVITDDGTYEIEITAKDRAGNSSASVSKRILRDNVEPVITITKPASADGAYIKAGSYQFEGTIIDDGGVAEAKVQVYSVSGTTETPFGEEQVLDLQEDGSWILKVYELTAGEYKIKVTATDKAANDAEEKESYPVKIDNTAPSFTIAATGLNDFDGNPETSLTAGTTYYANGNYEIIVTVDDINFENNYTDEALYTVTEGNISQELTTVNDSDKTKFKFSPTTPVDGIFVYTIKVQDKAGNKANDVFIKVQRDTTGPTVTIKNPKEDITDPTKALDDDSYSFRINASDGSGVGVAKLFYAFSTNPTAPQDSEWVEELFSDGDMNIEMNLGTTVLYDSDGKKTQLSEGNWYLYAKAADKSTNVTQETAKREIRVDKSAPVLTVTDLHESGINPLYAEIQNGGYLIKGTVSDTNELDATNAVTIFVNDVQKKTFTKEQVADGTWNFSLTTGSMLKADEQVTVKVVAKDIAGKTTPKTYILFYDTKLPALEITSPAENEPVETNSKIIKGTVSDDGYGIQNIYFELRKKGTSTIVKDSDNKEITSDNYPLIIKGEQWFYAGADSSSPNPVAIPLGTSQGALELYVTATEKTITNSDGTTSGGRVSNSTVEFYYDEANPDLTESGIGTRGKTTKESFTLSGVATDSNALASVEISWGTNNKITLTPTSSQLKSMNWSQEFVVGTATGTNHVADGANDFTIIAKDITGKEKQLTRTVVVDTQVPVVGDVTVDATGGETINDVLWYKTTSIPVTVPVTEYGVSGVSKVEYKAGGSSTWSPLSSNGTNYIGTVNFAGNGTQSLVLKATDVAGNESDEKTVIVNIDTSAPDLTALYYKKGSEAAKTLDSAVYLKTGTQITVYGNYKDEQSGVQNLTFKIGDTAVTPTVKYSTTAIENSAPVDSSYTIASTAMTGKETTIKSWMAVITPTVAGQFTVTGKNRVQTETSGVGIFTIAIDGTAPTVTIINPAEGATGTNALNGTTYSFRINADDGSGVGVTKLSYAFATTSTAPSAATAWTTIDFTGGDKNIDMPIVTGTTPGTDANGKVTSLCEGDWYVFAKAVDKAGNETATAVSRAFTVDRSNPSLSVTGLNESGVNALYKEITDDKYVLGGTVSDTNALAATDAVTIEIDEQTPVSATVNGTSWTYNLNVGTAAGTLKKDSLVSVKVTAKDIAGKTSEKEYTLYYDTKDPELEITAPVNDEAVETGTKVIKGTVSDGGYGIKKLEYSLYRGSTLIASGDTDHPNADYPIAIKGEQWYISKNDGKVTLGTTEGSLSLTVKATENKPEGATAVTGTREYVTTKTVNFYYDEANPELTEEGIGTRGKTTNAGFTLSGSATDTNALASVEISWGTNNKITLTPTDEQLKSMNWSQAFVVGSATGTNHVNDGANDFTIIAKDITGKEKQVTRTVVVDTQKPEIGTVTVDATGGETINDVLWYKTTSIPVTVPVTEYGVSGVSKVEYKAGGSSTWSPLSYDGTNYTGTINFAGNGAQSLSLKATDVAGNESEEKTVSVNIDTSAPDLTALYYKKGSETAKTLDSAVYLKTNTQITVYGNYNDEQSGVENLTFKIGNTTVTPTVTYSTTAIENSALVDSSYTIASTAMTGKETTIKSWMAVITPTVAGQFTVTGKNRVQTEVSGVGIFTVAIDGTAPTVTIINPTEGTTGTNAINGTSYSFRINADDGSGVGVTKLSYAFATTSTAPSAATAWTTIDFTGGDKNIDMPIVTGKTPVTTNGKVTSLCEGDWYVFAKAVDKAGNETATAVSRAFTVDRSNPTLTVSGLNESGVNALYKEISSNKYVLSGTVSDTNALASTGAVSIEIDEQSPVSATVSGNTWTYNLNVGTAAGTLKADTLVSVKVTAKDVTGKTTEKEYTLYYDTKDPELEVTAPVGDEAVETGTKVIKGTVSDGGYGISKLEYKLYSGETLIASGDNLTPSAAYPIAIKGEQWYISKNDGKVPLGSTEGALRLVVTATENKPEGATVVSGTREYVTTKTVNFYYDTANPTLTETLVGATGKTKNEGFTLSGLATDSNALASVEISWGTNNKITLTPTSSQLKSMNWSQEFVVGTATGTNHVNDGTNEFTIIAKDITGKEKQLTRTVIVDTVSPTCGTPTITSSKNTVNGKDWYKSSFIDIRLENVKDEGGTGISKVEYSTDNSNWYSMSGSGTTYTATVNCTAQGANTISVKVTDVAGNETVAGTLTAYVDTKEPSLENSYAKYLTGGYEAVSELLINGDNGYELKISAKDEDGGTGTNAGNNSGIASVQYSYGSYTIDGTKSGDDWIITVPTTADNGSGTDNYSSTGSNKIYVIIKDNAGNEIKERVLTVTKDTTDPTVEIKSFTRAGSQTNSVDNVNGTITISGLADDSNRFGSVKLEYQKDGTSTWTLIPTTSQTSWSTTLDTTTLTDNKKYTIKATATDAAGNTAEDTQDIYVNQDTDRPVITVTNMTLATVANETSYLKRTSRLEGTVSDDDGNVTKLEYSTNGTTWTEATLEYGTAWSIADLDEGDNKLYFRVTDSVITTPPFETAVEDANATEEAAGQPKIKDASNTYVTPTQGSLALNFMVVTKQPDVDEKKYQVFNSVANNGVGAWEDRDSLGTLGGIYTKFKISLKAKAEASISKVQAKYTTEVYDINFTCDDTNHSGNGYHIWRTGEIDLVDGKTEVKIKVSDASSTTDPMTLEQTISYSVDNTPPTINIKAPSSTAGVKETMQFDLSEAAVTYYAVTKSDVTTAPDADSSAWTEITDTSNGLTRYVFFDDDLNETDHTDRFALYLTEATQAKPNRLGITTVAAIGATTSPYETITPVKFWVKAVDNCGNEATKDQLVNVDPQGNRPTVTLGYPVNVLKNGTYVAPTLGGTIRLDGNVTDDEAPKYVWIKIERENQTFSGADVKFLHEQNYTIGDMTTNEVVAAATITALANNADVSDYAIRVPVTGTSWNLSINGNQEFNVENAEAHLKFKIYATDADPDKVDPTEKHIHRSAEISQQIVIDSRNPYISASDLKLVKYGDNSANQEYKEGTSVHGIWYLQGTIKDDDSGLRTISYKKNSEAEYTDVITSAGAEETNIGGDSHFYFTKVTHTDDASKYDYNFSVPLGNATSGQVGTDSITLKAVEATGQNLQVEQTYSVTYDNKAPVFNADTSNAFVKLSTDVYNSSGFYTFGAIASEDKVTVNGTDVSQSGVERIAFYFTRDLSYGLNQLDSSVYTKHSGTTTNDLFDVMIYHSNVDATDVTSGNMIVGYQDAAAGLTYSEGLYWRAHTGTANGRNFTYTDDVDPNIHAGGLVKINGVIYKIESVSGKTITLPSNIDSATSAQFALCNVIDNSGEKNGSSTSSDHGYGFGYYGSRATDDGDLITETFNSQGTDWIFDASINSRNLPDGPITLHMVAFDKAGNVTAPHTTTGTVKNNAPRIAGLILGTDENGNGSVDDGEFVSVYSGRFTKGYDTAGNEMHTASFPVVPDGGEQTALLTVKGLTVVKPEIIGGNGAISYSYQVGSGNKVSGGDLVNADGDNISGTTDDVVTGVITLPVSAFIGTTNGQDTGAIPDGTMSEFKFTFGDSTPGTSLTDITGKNSAIMKVFLDVALRETTKAKNWILPFYWNSASDNSLFNQSKDNGHIELAADWVTTETYTTNAAKAANQQNAEYDADPKVSGKIKIEGIAQDDTLLRDIKVKFGKLIGTTETPIFAADTDKTIATYNAATASWTVTALGANNSLSNWASAVQQATYQDLLDVGIITAIPDDKEPTSKVPYTSQDYGHVVHWILYLDTEKVTGVANTDVTVTATATDRGTPKWNSTNNAPAYTANAAATTGGTAISGAVTKSGANVSIAGLTGNYRVDVVPYIIDISTELSEGNKKRPTVLSRSALGLYPIRRNSKLTVNGFNLNGTSTGVSIGGTAYTPQTGTTTNAILIDTTKPVTTNATLASGEVIATVGTVISLNNKTAKSITTGTGNSAVTRLIEYNQEPNGQNNDMLTDKREVWVVDVTTTTNTNDKRKLDMVISGTTITFGSGYQDSYYSTMVANGTALSNIQNLRNSFTRYFDSAIDANDDGTIFTVSSCGDTYMGPVTQWTNGPSHFALTRGNAGTGKAAAIWEYDRKSSSDSGYTPSTNVSKIYLESNWNGSNLNNLERFLWPDIVVTGGDSATKGYISYYDTTQKLIKFRYFTSDGSKVANNLASYQAGNTSDTIVEGAVNTNTTYSQGYVAIAGANENSQYSVVGVTSNGTALVSWYDAANGALKMKYNTSPETSFSGYQDFSTVPGTGTITFDLKVDGGSSKSVSVAWSNVATGARNNHEFAYQLNLVLSNGYGAYAEVDPKTNRVTVRSMQTGTSSSIAITNLRRNNGTNNAGAVNNAVAGVGSSWVEKTIDENSAGQYVAMKTDTKGGIHFAYYDTGNGDLKYAYMSSVTATPVVVTVDGYQQVGQYVDIAVKEEVDEDNDNISYVIPYISYYSMSNADTKRAAKVAKLVSPIVYTTTNDSVTSNSAAVKAGSVDELFTGNWEAMHIPTNGIPVQYRVNIGVTSGGNVYIGYLADRIIEYVKVE